MFRLSHPTRTSAASVALRAHRHLLCFSLLAALLQAPAADARADVPPGFEVTTVASGFQRPVAITFARDGRIFVAEQEGLVWVVQDGAVLAEPFIDLREEVQGVWDRGLLDVELDPDFMSNRHVYLLYTVDPIPGEPDEKPHDGSHGRLTRYTGTSESGGNVADPESRFVILGDEPAEGIPVCDPSHTIGRLRFAADGSLFLSAGDGAHFNQIDAGGLDEDCFGPDMFNRLEDIGAFRSQYLGSLAGKILRIDPETGLGVPENPYWTGDGEDNQSRVWVSGLRNPYRFAIKPHSPLPGTLFIGDVGWGKFEEINIAAGGENFGWPCYEGPDAVAGYQIADPHHSGCETIATQENPGPLTSPTVSWHHSQPSQSDPPGFTGATAVGGAFYTAGCYPAPYRDVFFFADYAANWIKALEVDAENEFVALHDFGTGLQSPVDLVAHPRTGDLYYVAIFQGEVRRISFASAGPADLDCDGAVSFQDLLLLLGGWGQCLPPPDTCRPDIDADGFVGVVDLLFLLAHWTG